MVYQHAVPHPTAAITKPSRSLRRYLPPLTFITLHYAYFIGVCLLSSVIFWASSTPPRSVSYTDSLFFTVSAMTLAGLNTVNLSQLNTWQQFILFLLTILGSAILVSTAVVHVRRKAFERKLKRVVEKDQQRPKVEKGALPDKDGLPFTLSRRRSIATEEQEVDDVAYRGRTMASKHRSPLATLIEERKELLRGTSKYFQSGGFVGRNSQFYSLTLSERERLGGVEYRAIMLLEVIVPVYFVLWQLFGCIGLGAYVSTYRADTTLQNGLNPWWVGAFNAVSAFNNSGMSLLDANMVAFQTSTFMLTTMGLLILAGNTCYPVFLRMIIWTLLRVLPDKTAYQDRRVTLQFLLDHPRRCYTTLFPSRHTWWLLGSIILLNGIDWAAFEILNIGNSATATLPGGARALDGLFQAVAVRSGGFYVVSIAQLRIGLLVLYVIMMYISVYPVVITMRNSNVYEERSLGIYSDDTNPDYTSEEADAQRPFLQNLLRRVTKQRVSREPRGYFVRQQLRGQLAHDLWWIVLAILFIVITETSQFERDPINYSVFNVIFEVISAYGCVGISIGLPGVAYSFCGGWHTLSKLILCAVMIRGRHRGLPVAIDRAVLLPGEELGVAEEEDARIRLERMSGRW